nr:Spy/CpxP family protein refolding chaperone [uncultured Draconibacterium sp.]
MKTSKLINVAWVFFALVLTTTTVFAQRGRRANMVQNNQNLPCLTQVANLSEDQVKSIKELEASHQKTMDELRGQRRTTVNAVEKSEIRTEMLKTVETHRNDVRNLLTTEQQEQYDQLQASVSYGRNQNVGRGNGNANFNRRGRGNGNAGFRGQGNGYGNRVYAQGQNQGRGNRGWNQGRRGNCILLNSN